jgi:Fe-S cluster biogenesis protein NfuA
MFIQTEATPNPDTLKFLPGQPVLGEGGRDFASAEEGQVSPLAVRLFEVSGVARVFLGSDFVSVSKTPESDWRHVKTMALAAIMDHFMSGMPVIDENASATAGASEIVYEGDAAEIVEEIKELIETRVRPAVAQDGGDIIFDRFDPETGLVTLHMRGACAGCPSSTMTLKQGIENMLRHYVPEVTGVEAAL